MVGGSYNAEVLLIHQQQGSASDKANNHRTQPHKGSLDDGAIVMTCDEVTSIESEYEWREYNY